MRILRRYLSVGGLLAAFLLPIAAHAGVLTAPGITQGISDVCARLGNCQGAAGPSAYIYTKIVVGLRALFIGVALVMVFLNAIGMVMGSQDESTVSESRSGLYYTIIGGAIVLMTDAIVSTFMVGNGLALVNASPFETGVGKILTYILAVMGAAVLANTTIQGFRMVTSQGEQGQIDKAKKRLLGGFIGVAIILLSHTIVAAALPGSSSGILNPEIAGIAFYFLTILGTLALGAIMIAGVLLVVSVDESMKEKAKHIVKLSIVTIVIVACALALVTTFL